MEDKNSDLHLRKIASGKDGKCFIQLLGVLALMEPWQMCITESPPLAAGAAAELRHHKLLLPHETAVVGHCYNASTLLRSPGAEESDSSP